MSESIRHEGAPSGRRRHPYETGLLKKTETESDRAFGSNFKGQRNVLDSTTVVQSVNFIYLWETLQDSSCLQQTNCKARERERNK